ncbi:MAG: peptidoglycan-binding protein [Magnetococcales bacterium]|nr:peptidoglycan-binding protein [Magnetococcales bacterium]
MGAEMARAGDRNLEEDHIQGALTILMNMSGPFHALRVTLLSRLADLQINRGRQEEALKSSRTALAIGENIWGEFHPNLIPILRQLAAMELLSGGEVKNRKPYYPRLLTLARHFYGEVHPLTLDLQLTRAELLTRTGAPGLAQVLMDRLADRLQTPASRENADLQDRLLTIRADLLESKGRFAEAERLVREDLIRRAAADRPSSSRVQPLLARQTRLVARLAAQSPANPDAADPDPLRELLRQVQIRLTGLGYDLGPADGHPGPRTRQAARHFQRQMGLTPIANLDANGLHKLLQHLPPPDPR